MSRTMLIAVALLLYLPLGLCGADALAGAVFTLANKQMPEDLSDQMALLLASVCRGADSAKATPVVGCRRRIRLVRDSSIDGTVPAATTKTAPWRGPVRLPR